MEESQEQFLAEGGILGKTRTAEALHGGGLRGRQFPPSDSTSSGEQLKAEGRVAGSTPVRIPENHSERGHWAGMEDAGNWSGPAAEAEGEKAVGV